MASTHQRRRAVAGWRALCA